MLHPLSLRLAHRLDDCCFRLPDFADLLSLCLCQEDLLHLFTLGNLLDTVGLGLGGPTHCSDELLVRTQDLLCLHGNLFLALHNLNLNLFLPDLLLLTGPCSS